MKSNYSEVEIYPKNHDMAKPWFVAFSFTDVSTGMTKRFQYRGKINSKKNRKDRLREAISLRDALTVMLDDGWNPFNGNIEAESEAKFLPLVDALDRLLEVKKSFISFIFFREITLLAKKTTTSIQITKASSITIK